MEDGDLLYGKREEGSPIVEGERGFLAMCDSPSSISKTINDVEGVGSRRSTWGSCVWYFQFEDSWNWLLEELFSPCIL